MRTVMLLSGIVFASLLHAQAFQPYERSRITQAQWQVYFDEVQQRLGSSALESQERRLIVFADELTSTTYAFTKPGNPAHPAWVTSRVFRQQGKVNVAQIGYFAGDQAAFESLFRYYASVNDKLKREADKRSAPARNSHEP